MTTTAQSKTMSLRAQLTTKEVAGLLNISPAHLVKLLEDGVLALHSPVEHRQVSLADLMQYIKVCDRASEHAMAELARQAQELGMGYD